MHRFFKNFILGFICLCAISLQIGCFDSKTFLKKILPEHIEVFSKQSIFLLKNSKIEDTMNRISQNKLDVLNKDEIQAMMNKMPSSNVLELTSIDATHFKYDDYIEYYGKYEIRFRDQLQIAKVGVREENNVLKIIELKLYDPIDMKYGEHARKTIIHYLFAILTIGYVVIILIALFLCVKSPIDIKWRVLFFFICLLGIFKIVFNWNNGAIDFQLFSIGVTLPAFKINTFSNKSHWILSFYFPLGAFIFLYKRNKIMKRLSIKRK